MRWSPGRSALPGILAVGVAAWAGCDLAGQSERQQADPASADVIRTLTLELPPPEEGGLKVVNLVGEFTVVPAEGDAGAVEVEVTVHGGSAELADGVRLERQSGGAGEELTLRVIFPTDRYSTFRYGDREGTGSGWLDLLGGADSSTGLEYDGMPVRVSNARGAALHADVEVRLPPGGVTATFVNAVGSLSASKVEGRLSFRTISGHMRLESVSGTLEATVSRGELRGTALRGELTCSTTTGDVFLRELSGERVKCSSTTGDIEVAGASGGRVELSTVTGRIRLDGAATPVVVAGTTTGDIVVEGAGLVEVEAKSASGDILLECANPGLARVEAESVGGSVQLVLNDGLAFEAATRTTDGIIENKFPDAEPIMDGDRVVGFRRGTGGARINISTAHGNLSLYPGP